MIGKNLIAVLIFVVVLAVGFFGYQHFAKTKDLEAHYKDTYSRLTEIANKSPRTGIDIMGRANNKYFAEIKSYPPDLNALYPKYINDQSFINKVNWNYQPVGDNYQLSKSVVQEGRTLVASTDKSLNVRTGTTTTVAMVDADPKGTPAAEKPDQTPSPEAMATLERLAKDTPSDLPPTDGATVDQGEKNIEPQETETRTVVLDETDTPSNLVSELSNAYLVWKDNQGRLGFGNVQYPRTDGLSIATPFNWYQIKSRLENEASGTEESIRTSAKNIDMEVIAAKYSNQYLVWKDENGNIGFGDTEYPDQEKIEYVNIDGTWHKFAR